MAIAPRPDETADEAHQRADDDYANGAGTHELRLRPEDPDAAPSVVLPASWRPRRKH